MAVVKGRSTLPKTRIPTDVDLLQARAAAVVVFVGAGVFLVAVSVLVVALSKAAVL